MLGKITLTLMTVIRRVRRMRIAHLSWWFWNKSRVLETVEELLPPRLVLVLQATVLVVPQAAMMVVPQVAVLVVPKAVVEVTEMLAPRRSWRRRRQRWNNGWRIGGWQLHPRRKRPSGKRVDSRSTVEIILQMLLPVPFGSSRRRGSRVRWGTERARLQPTS